MREESIADVLKDIQRMKGDHNKREAERAEKLAHNWKYYRSSQPPEKPRIPVKAWREPHCFFKGQWVPVSAYLDFVSADISCSQSTLAKIKLGKLFTVF